MIYIAVLIVGIQVFPVETDMAVAVNAERTQRGLPALVMDSGDMQQSCRDHCYWMAEHGRMVHAGPYAENIAAGQGSVKEVMNVWMHSSGHRANILGRNYTYVAASGWTSERGVRYWCLRFR